MWLADQAHEHLRSRTSMTATVSNLVCLHCLDPYNLQATPHPVSLEVLRWVTRPATTTNTSFRGQDAREPILLSQGLARGMSRAPSVVDSGAEILDGGALSTPGTNKQLGCQCVHPLCPADTPNWMLALTFLFSRFLGSELLPHRDGGGVSRCTVAARLGP